MRSSSSSSLGSGIHLLSLAGPRPLPNWLEGKWSYHGDWKAVAGIRRLRDLVKVPAGMVLQHADEIQLGWVVLSFKIGFIDRNELRDREFDQYDRGDYYIYWDRESNTFWFPTVNGTTLGCEAFNIALNVYIENDAGKAMNECSANLELASTEGMYVPPEQTFPWPC